MEIETLFGLPAHPLVVHAAVVLVPLTAIGALLCLYPPIRRHLARAVFVLSIVGTVAVAVAEGSGESLQENVDETHLVEEHAEMGETLLPWTILLMIACAGLVGVDEITKRTTAPSGDDAGGSSAGGSPRGVAPSWLRPAGIVVAVLVVVSSAMSIDRVIEIGHSGAKATWSEGGEGAEGGR